MTYLLGVAILIVMVYLGLEWFAEVEAPKQLLGLAAGVVGVDIAFDLLKRALRSK